MPIDRNADPAAMAARIKELEAALAAQPPAPQTPVAAILAVGASIMGLFPKWLIAAGLAVFIAFHAFSYYQQARQMAAQTASIEMDADAKAENVHNYLLPTPPQPKRPQPTDTPAPTREQRLDDFQRELEAHGAADGGSCDVALDFLPKGTKATAPIQRGAGLPLPPCVSRSSLYPGRSKELHDAIRKLEAHGAADGGSCDVLLEFLPKGTAATAPIQRGAGLPRPACVSLNP